MSTPSQKVKTPALGKSNSAKSKKNRVRTKAYLASPHNSSIWPTVSLCDRSQILGEIEKVFKSLSDKIRKSKSSGRKAKNTETDSTHQSDPESQNLKKQFVCGLNEVTRALEKGLLRLVIVGHAVMRNPAQFLLPLCLSRETPVLYLPTFSDAVAPLLGLKALAVFGFKKVTKGDQPAFNSLVEFISSKTPPVNEDGLYFKSWSDGTKTPSCSVKRSEADSILPEPSPTSLTTPEQSEPLVNHPAVDQLENTTENLAGVGAISEVKDQEQQPSIVGQSKKIRKRKKKGSEMGIPVKLRKTVKCQDVHVKKIPIISKKEKGKVKGKSKHKKKSSKSKRKH